MTVDETLRRRTRPPPSAPGRTPSACPRRARSRQPTPSSSRGRGGSVSTRRRSVRSSSREHPSCEVTATTPVVEIDLDARSQEIARVGAKVRIELPSGRLVDGTVASVGRVAETSTSAQGEVCDPTVAGRRPSWPIRGERDGLDGAAVTVSLERERAKRVLAVPVEALLALRGGGDAVELVGANGERTLVAVETGTFADGYVEIEGRVVRAETASWCPSERRPRSPVAREAVRRRRRRPPRRLARSRGGRAPRDRRPVGLGQVDAAPRARHARAADGGDAPDRRARGVHRSPSARWPPCARARSASSSSSSSSSTVVLRSTTSPTACSTAADRSASGGHGPRRRSCGSGSLIDSAHRPNQLSGGEQQRVAVARVDRR